MKLKVHEQNGKQTTKEVDLQDKIFAIDPSDHAIWLDVRVLRATRRQGTHSSKGRSEVSGGGRKPFRQKGTGRARQGTIRAPHHVGGGKAFGPKPKSYNLKINKKMRLLARRSALTYKARDNKVIVVENFDFDAPSTRQFLQLLSAFSVEDKKVLLCTADNAPKVVKSAANIHKVQVCESNNFSTYDILRADTMLIQQGALEKVNEVLGR